jgi:Kelch motif
MRVEPFDKPRAHRAAPRSAARAGRYGYRGVHAGAPGADSRCRAGRRLGRRLQWTVEGAGAVVPGPELPDIGGCSAGGLLASDLAVGKRRTSGRAWDSELAFVGAWPVPLTLTPHIAYDGSLWMTSQTRAYSSPDGLTWTEHPKTDWGERIYESIVYFKGRLWMYGGLDYRARTFLNDIWSSSDGVTWSKIGTASWSPRGSHTVVAYDDRLWLFGGASHITGDRSTDGFLNDVWVSDDGVAWSLVTHAAPWSPRDKAGVVAFNNELYLLGGQDTADVWRSSNGREWIPLLAEAEWQPRHDFARVAYRSRLWVFGGWKDRSTNALNDVWYSDDGITWTRQTDHAPWGPRSPISVVFQDKIWIYSGKHTGADDNWGGDLWQMTSGVNTTR